MEYDHLLYTNKAINFVMDTNRSNHPRKFLCPKKVGQAMFRLSSTCAGSVENES